MNFNDFKYKRPNLTELKEKFNGLLKKFNEAASFEEADKSLKEITELRNNFYSLSVLAFINYSIDTANKEYADEQEFFDNNNPVFYSFIVDFYNVLLKSKYRVQLEEKYGRHLFDIADISLKTFSHEVIEDSQRENSLQSKYTKIKASADIDFDGKKLNLQELEPYMESEDREVRKRAHEAYWKFFASHVEELDTLYDDLVKVRTQIAQKLGHKNFLPLGYARMRRTDYNWEDVAKFRQHILNHIVPLCSELRESQRKRLGLEKLAYYDIPVKFKTGNATPKGDPEWIVENGKEMYSQLSPQTKEFFDSMIERNLMDLYSRKGKADMGYCDYIPDYKAPFIFANMNGTEGDITVLTHEAGHAFQAYSSRVQPFKEYQEPTMETAEIHSMSMEFFTWPWMNLFFKEDTDKFKYSHITNAVLFLPYGCLIDHFQQVVYENPELTPVQRRGKYRELEKQYMPWLDFEGNHYLESGGRWQRQGHVFEGPFYYIDYVLAQICAFQFWSRSEFAVNGEKDKAFKDYLYLCEAGGSNSFLKLIEKANIDSPFEEKTITSVTDKIKSFLSNINDASL